MPQARYGKVGLPRPTVLALAFVTLLGTIAAASATARAQGVGPGRGLPPPQNPATSGAAPAPKPGGEAPRPRRTGSVARMQLLAPNVGWATNGPQLLWTSSGGAEWEDITPPGPKGAVVGGIFFLDTRRGWVLLKHGEPDIPGGLQFDLASTDDAGATWSMRHVTVPQRRYSGSDILNGGILAFADSVHGWLGLGEGLSAAYRDMGVLLVTGDGGESWKLATATGWDTDDTIGPMLMLTPEQGWMVGDDVYNELLVTRDGGRTWQRIELESPVKTDKMRENDRKFAQFERSFAGTELARMQPQHPPSHAVYRLPTFEDPKHGYVSVTYPGVTVLFATEDGGVSWKPDRVVEGRPVGPSAVVGSTWITARVPKNGMPQLANVAPGATIEPSTPPNPEDRPAYGMSFATPSQGWVVTNESKLLATNDGGATWTDITPGWPTGATP